MGYQNWLIAAMFAYSAVMAVEAGAQTVVRILHLENGGPPEDGRFVAAP
jgi:hypothetical protein